MSIIELLLDRNKDVDRKTIMVKGFYSILVEESQANLLFWILEKVIIWIIKVLTRSDEV